MKAGRILPPDAHIPRRANVRKRRYLVIAARSGKFCLLTREPTFGVGDEDYSSCPEPAIGRRHRGPIRQVGSGHLLK